MIAYCNQKCADAHWNTHICGRQKREREEEEEIDSLPIMAAIATVRLSGLYNMYNELQGVYTSVCCLLNLWQRTDLVIMIVRLENESPRYFAETFMTAYRENFTEQQAVWENLAAAMPFSRDYMDAADRFDPDARSQEFQDFLRARNYHRGDRNWAQFITQYATEQCYNRGVHLRDTVQLERLRGVFDKDSLCLFGAQF